VGKKKDSSKELRHVRLYHWMLQTEAWRGLSVVARALYIELSSRYYGINNGKIVLSVRQAAKALHVSKDTVARAFEELQARGFAAVTQKGGFNLKDRKGQATEWRLTEFPYGAGAFGTKEFTRWSTDRDFAVQRGPKPNSPATKVRHRANDNPIPLANYKRPTRGTVGKKSAPLESHPEDQNVASEQHQSHHEDRSVPSLRLGVSAAGPCPKSGAASDTCAAPTIALSSLRHGRGN
jgi:DNA-binding transcriptional MocR family regulator